MRRCSEDFTALYWRNWRGSQRETAHCSVSLCPVKHQSLAEITHSMPKSVSPSLRDTDAGDSSHPHTSFDTCTSFLGAFPTSTSNLDIPHLQRPFASACPARHSEQIIAIPSSTASNAARILFYTAFLSLALPQ